MPCGQTCGCETRKTASPALMVAIGAAVVSVGTTALLATQRDAPQAHADTTPAPIDSPAADARPADDVLAFTINRLDGEPQSLEAYRGKVVLIVNTASRCGLTPQYEGLERLYRDHKDEGFVVLGFPANNFMGQEPGTDAQIAAFCEENFGVSFPMFTKISVKGDDQHPLYKKLTSQPEPIGGDPEWNFTKFLVNRQGRVVARFGPRTRPDDPKLVERIAGLLAEPTKED